MSGPGKQKIVAAGIIGSNNILQDVVINVIGEQINQTNLSSISLRDTSIWFDVREPVESFTGRRKELKKLHEEVQRNLRKNEHKITVISQVTSISGLGGIGKSEIARMYAHEYGKDYDNNVIWINAETYGTLTESFHRLAKDKLNISTKSIDYQEKDINSIVQEVYKYFSKRKSLFIFDNAEKMRTEKKEGIQNFLPFFQSIDDNKPYIIITSRNQNWEEPIKVISIDTFSEEEAIEFIKKKLDVSDESQIKEIRLLAKTLQCFPLALQQAMAYIKHTDKKLKNFNEKKFEITDYLKRFEENEENARKLLNYHFPEDSSNCYIKTTFITWEVTLQKIKQNKYGQQALEVLENIAYFAPDNIPTKIFLELVNDDIEIMGTILELLAQYSMVNLEQGVLNIHRLVQQVIRLGLKDQQKEEKTLRKALKLIKIPIEEEYADSSKYLSHAISVWNYASNIEEGNVNSSRYLLHAISAWNYARNYVWNYAIMTIGNSNNSNNDNSTLKKELIVFSSQITFRLIYDTRYQEAYAFSIQTLELLKGKPRIGHLASLNTEYDMALVIGNQGKHEIFHEVSKLTERVLGAEHPSTLATRNNLALMLDKQAKYDNALEIYQEVFKILERVSGGEHPHTLMTRHNMALVLNNQGKYKEALGIYQEVFNIQERVLGGEHPSTLTTRNNIALVLEKQGKYDEALGIYQEVFNIRERILGREHPSTLTTRNNMASLLHKQGKYDEPLRIYKEVLKIRERVSGGEHPDTLMTRHNMAYVLDKQGKYNEALGIYQEVFNIKERILGEEHPDTLISRNNIALVLDKQGKYDEALGIYQEVFNIKERILGREHPSTLRGKHNIASVLDNQGKYDQALKIFQEIFNLRKRVLGAEHPDTLTTRHYMAFVLGKEGKYNEALGIYQEVFYIQERILGGEHHSTLSTRNNMASVLYKQGKYDEALGIHQKVFNILERVLGGEHPNTLSSRNNMAAMLHMQGKYDEALEIYQEVFNIKKRVLGGEHPSTLSTRHNMASVLHKKGKYDEALGIYQEVFNIQEHVLGGEHPSTLSTRHNMASVLEKQSKYDEALGIYRHVFNIRERVLGGEHPDTLTTRHNMALMLDKQGKHDEALGIYQEVFNIRERVLGGEHPDTLITRNRLTSVK